MKTARYKAIWTYSQCCLRKGQEFASCEADTLPEFASELCTTYAYNLGDGFWFARYENEAELRGCFGEDSEDLPEWFNEITAYPVLVFSSGFGEEILCKHSATAIISQIQSESYGDYDLEIKGI